MWKENKKNKIMSKYRIVKVESNTLETANIGRTDAYFYLFPTTYYEVQEKINFFSKWETIKKCRSERDSKVYIEFVKNKDKRTIIK